MIVVTIAYCFVVVVVVLHRELVHIYFTQKKMIGYHTRLRGDDDLPQWRGSAV